MLLNKRIPIPYIFNKIKYEIIYVLVIALLVYYLSHKFYHILPDIPLTIPAFIGTSISVLLSFKLNQSYDRWWEARKIWGSIVNDSRSFVVQALNFIAKNNDATIKKMGYRQIAWCYSLGQSLRNLDSTKNIEHLISAEEMAEISKHDNTPLALINLHAKDLARLKENNQLELFAQIQMDSTLVRLVESMGKAERIKNTVFPVTYRLFLHFVIYLFIFTLAVSLQNIEVYFEVTLHLLLSAAFFLLDRTAKYMQDPFENKPTDTAVTTIARNIDINIRQLLDETEVPEKLPEEKFYSM